jgi:hypothetical protein
LKRFRPLKDHRVVQRYLRAVESAEAGAWHTLVYGLVLSVYSLPLRQGLFDYARHTFSGFARSLAGYLHLSAPDFQNLLAGIEAQLPGEVDQILTRCTPARPPRK